MVSPRVLGYLGRAMSHELSAVQQYLTHAGLAKLWGMDEVCEHFRREALEEQEHAERLTNRMLQLGAMPNASQLTPVRAGPSLIELLEADRLLELRAVELYREAAQYCALIGDTEDRALFHGLHDEELTHAREIETWLDRLRREYALAWNR
ncbi:bacterioferritin [Thiorhodococcus mannitoliphagus]|uniref:Bacterioferritin n=1 Tax=Thiorhodococcus mannitoliphagus TaxID=329406 RepID=A0A6P1DZU0_9GAMM|nr:ferritin-like domain-containing protein [Thiorhodococcus mannitoliphagus]NEX23010.1 bacterioferritin [Thiorhodococcus mannitoliphagus]